MRKRGIVILLTATIKPGGMTYTVLQDRTVREKQYREALSFYLSTTDSRIVFCENSGIDISADFKKYRNEKRVEFLTFEGNNFNRELGKGYGEATIIQYAIENSAFLKEANYVIKITGRLIVRNVEKLLNSKVFYLRDNIVRCDFVNDLAIYTMVYICPLKWLKLIIDRKDEINDAKGIWIEHVMYNMLLLPDYCVVPFFTSPVVEGICGSSGKEYKPIPRICSNNIRYLSNLMEKKNSLFLAYIYKAIYKIMVCFDI